MNNIKVGNIVVVVNEISDYCNEGKVGVVIKYKEHIISDYPYTVMIADKEFYFSENEIKKVGGLLV